MNKVYEIITERIIEHLEAGTIPWEKPWSAAGQPPANATTGRPYSGINILLLASMPYTSPYWLTYRQAKQCGGHVKKGEKSTPVVFWKINKYDKETGRKISDKEARKRRERGEKDTVKTVPILRYYNVFNVEQCEGLDPAKIESVDVDTYEWNSLQLAENIVNGYTDRPEIRHAGESAFYTRTQDYVNMPPRDRFSRPEKYYKVLFHELAHSTGHKKRLGRFGDGTPARFGSKDYSKEELIAEITTAFLCGETAILETTIENSAAYIKNWLQVFKNKDNKTLIVHAAANAQHAADYILKRD